MANISSSKLALDVSGQRNDKVVTSEVRGVESLGKGYGSFSALDRSTALDIDIHPAPPKPADEKIMKRIETLCQFIAKNGPGFEDMARTRESANPEFKFLFGGEPGSDAAVAHEYYQWAKKKYTFGDKLREDASNLRPSEADISVQSKPFIMTSVAHPNSDSDMEMEGWCKFHGDIFFQFMSFLLRDCLKCVDMFYCQPMQSFPLCVCPVVVEPFI